MEAKTLSPNLEENLTYFTGRFQNAMDLMVRRVELSGRKAAMIAIDGLVNKETITLSLLEPLLKTEGYPDQPEAMVDFIESQVLSAADLRRERRMDKLLTLLMSGFVLLCVDGSGEGLVSGVQGFAYRSPQEPQNEVMQRGAKDGFTESNQLNMAMIRRRMKSTSLKFEPGVVLSGGRRCSRSFGQGPPGSGSVPFEDVVGSGVSHRISGAGKCVLRGGAH